MTPAHSAEREAVVVRIGAALHRFGTPVDQLEEALGRLARGLAVHVQVLATPTSITFAFGGSGEGRMVLLRGNQGDTDLARLTLLWALAAEVARGRVAPAAAAARIDAILAAPPAWGAATAMLAFAGASGAVARILGGGAVEAGVAALIGLAMGVLVQQAGRRPRLARVLELVAPIGSAWIAQLAALAVGPYSMAIATLAGIIILVPGMAATTALSELAVGHLVAGTARGMGAMVTFLKLGFGVALGMRTGASLLGPLDEAPAHAEAWALWPAIAMAAISVAVVLQAQRRDLLAIVVCACLSFFALRSASGALGPELALFVAACAVTLCSNGYARATGRPASVTQVPALLLLVPGTVGYRSVSALLHNDVLGGVQTALSMGLDAMALVAGALLAGLLTPPHEEV